MTFWLGYRWSYLKLWFRERPDKMAWWLAWKLPRRVALFAFVRVSSAAQRSLCETTYEVAECGIGCDELATRGDAMTDIPCKLTEVEWERFEWMSEESPATGKAYARLRHLEQRVAEAEELLKQANVAANTAVLVAWNDEPAFECMAADRKECADELDAILKGKP